MKQRWATIKIAYPSMRLTTYQVRALAGLCVTCKVAVVEYRKCKACRGDWQQKYGGK